MAKWRGMTKDRLSDEEMIEAAAASIQSGINRAKELVRQTEWAIREQPPVPEILSAPEELRQS